MLLFCAATTKSGSGPSVWPKLIGNVLTRVFGAFLSSFFFFFPAFSQTNSLTICQHDSITVVVLLVSRSSRPPPFEANKIRLYFVCLNLPVCGLLESRPELELEQVQPTKQGRRTEQNSRWRSIECIWPSDSLTDGGGGEFVFGLSVGELKRREWRFTFLCATFFPSFSSSSSVHPASHCTGSKRKWGCFQLTPLVLSASLPAAVGSFVCLCQYLLLSLPSQSWLAR